ncbi:MAG: hypothetical protein ACP5M9_02330, partial [Candidatus Micrarchaeia archaeon]
NFAYLKESVIKSMEKTSTSKTSLSYSVREKVMKTKLRRVYDKLPHTAKKVIHKSVGTVLSSASSSDYTRLHLFDYEMSKTIAFAGISNINVATIFINDKRFEKGIVKPEQISTIKKRLAKELVTITDSKGNKIIKNVYDALLYYNKKPQFIAPDLFVEAMPNYSIDIFNFSKKTIFMKPEPPKRGDHTRMAIFGAYTPKSKPNISNIKINQIAATIQKYFNL